MNEIDQHRKIGSRTSRRILFKRTSVYGTRYPVGEYRYESMTAWYDSLLPSRQEQRRSKIAVRLDVNEQKLTFCLLVPYGAS
jgi:hypothetical protein